jgi:phytoene desaturase
MYLGVRGQFPELPHHTIYISKDYEGNLREIEQDKCLPKQPSFYVQNACVTDPSLAAPGKSALYVLVPVPHLSPNTPWDAKQTAEYRALTLKRLEAVGLGGLQDRIEYEKIITPADWRDQYSVYRGATFNLAHNLGQMLHLRPHNKFEDLQSVYLVGGGTHPGSGLPVIYESSRITSRQLLAELELPNSFIDELQPLPSSNRLEPALATH